MSQSFDFGPYIHFMAKKRVTFGAFLLDNVLHFIKYDL